MRDRDPSIDFDNLPTMQAEKRESAAVNSEVSVDATQEAPIYSETSRSTSSQLSSKNDHHSHYAMTVAVLALILAGVALAFAGVQLSRQGEKLENAQLRVAELENRLSTTDESVSQSGVALQITINDLKAKVDDLWTQMDKLWASAWRRNQTEITDHGKKIESIVIQQKKINEQAAQLNDDIVNAGKVSSNLKEDITVLQAETEDLYGIEKIVKLQKKQIAELEANIKSLKATNKKLQKQNEENAGWIASNNEFRQQTNKSLTRLEQQLKALQPTPK